jgi:anti-sigma regulatory factor (Ser/Thr protein kinase)
MKNLSELILELASKKERLTTKDVIGILPPNNKLSRQYVNKIIAGLVKQKKLIKGGSTRGAFYVHPKNQQLATGLTKVHLRLTNADLKEHIILDDVRAKALFFPSIKKNVQDIFNFGFSEMLNNAIEHSSSKFIEVDIYKDRNNLLFEVSDTGIGAFKSISSKKHLDSELSAIQDLLKGKTTTMPQAHSGEGIFFTSKMADLFILDSFEYRLRIDNKINDVFVELLKPIKTGTRVIFSISLTSKRHTTDVFQKYVSNPDTLAFDKTDVQIRLYTMGTIHVSRSQARRVLAGLDKFKTIILDFDRVPTIGQGFADEIFRVFSTRHPEIIVKPVRTNEAVQFMIDRVEKPQP